MDLIIDVCNQVLEDHKDVTDESVRTWLESVRTLRDDLLESRNEHTVVDTDNRDPHTTELVLEDGSRVTVNPTALFTNALDNNRNHLDELPFMIMITESEAVYLRWLLTEFIDEFPLDDPGETSLQRIVIDKVVKQVNTQQGGTGG